jgi:hypothetical protein
MRDGNEKETVAYANHMLARLDKFPSPDFATAFRFSSGRWPRAELLHLYS